MKSKLINEKSEVAEELQEELLKDEILNDKGNTLEGPRTKEVVYGQRSCLEGHVIGMMTGLGRVALFSYRVKSTTFRSNINWARLVGLLSSLAEHQFNLRLGQARKEKMTRVGILVIRACSTFPSSTAWY